MMTFNLIKECRLDSALRCVEIPFYPFEDRCVPRLPACWVWNAIVSKLCFSLQRRCEIPAVQDTLRDPSSSTHTWSRRSISFSRCLRLRYSSEKLPMGSSRVGEKGSASPCPCPCPGKERAGTVGGGEVVAALPPGGSGERCPRPPVRWHTPSTRTHCADASQRAPVQHRPLPQSGGPRQGGGPHRSEGLPPLAQLVRQAGLLLLQPAGPRVPRRLVLRLRPLPRPGPLSGQRRNRPDRGGCQIFLAPNDGATARGCLMHVEQEEPINNQCV